jgi:periplasmic divalent cation tolerance protein
MLIAWTTVAIRADADQLADEAVRRNLAVCVQINGPITSHYRWEGRVAQDQEFRLCFKVLPNHIVALEEFIMSRHPYDAPEWIVVRAEKVGEKYLSWANANSTTPPL